MQSKRTFRKFLTAKLLREMKVYDSEPKEYQSQLDTEGDKNTQTVWIITLPDTVSNMSGLEWFKFWKIEE